MPEGPEVEAARLSVEKYCQGSSVQDIVREEKGGGPRDGQVDDRVCLLSSAQVDTVLQQTVEQVNRKGKYFWIEFSQGSSLLFHLGMTGSIVFRNKKLPNFKAFHVSTAWPPKFTKLLMSFSNGEKMAFCDPRRLGRIQLVVNPLDCLPVSKLAPDPLLDGLSRDLFLSKLATCTAPIKSALLDQEKLCCGIGNWVADEVLYQSCIHPETPCNIVASSRSSTLRLVNTITNVLQQAIIAKADDKEFPSNWLFHYRWGKGKRNASTVDGQPISFITVGGRTSAVVPSRQKRIAALSRQRLDDNVKLKKSKVTTKKLSIDDSDSDSGDIESKVMTRARKRKSEANVKVERTKQKKPEKK